MIGKQRNRRAYPTARKTSGNEGKNPNEELTLVSQKMDSLYPEIEGSRGNMVMKSVMDPKKSADAMESSD